MYIWEAYCKDGSYTDESEVKFKTRKAAYEDMRNAVFEKMKWNTEFDEDFYDGEPINYYVEFTQDRITHESFSGVYVYEIKEVK